MKVYDIGLFIFPAAVVNILVGAAETNYIGNLPSLGHDMDLILRICTLVSGTTLALASILIPRRPDVLYGGEPVDGNFTVSALSRFTWAWGDKILELAGKMVI